MTIPKGPYKIAQPREELAILDRDHTVIGNASNLATAKLFQKSFLMAVFIREVMDQLPEDRQRQAVEILSDIPEDYE